MTGGSIFLKDMLRDAGEATPFRDLREARSSKRPRRMATGALDFRRGGGLVGIDQPPEPFHFQIFTWSISIVEGNLVSSPGGPGQNPPRARLMIRYIGPFGRF